ncbi:unnamed protein product [Arabis nemorensis]|uniref:Importin N-terminal domain-containing protein n=1 Tax=Arabis nemorensis TaxID=586526 RepID=A0A565CGG0_9BRAS|nr:unnamed protein product [Arabis nemorensis]
MIETPASHRLPHRLRHNQFLEEAIHVLNHNPESSNRVAANQWLVQFQQTPAAWDVSTSLLTSLFVSLFDLQFFAAQILHRKIQNEASNLQSTDKDALLNALLLAAKRYSSGVPQVETIRETIEDAGFEASLMENEANERSRQVCRIRINGNSPSSTRIYPPVRIHEKIFTVIHERVSTDMYPRED